MNEIFKYDFPKIMGIVNVTPDSFSDGGNYHSANDAIEHSLKLIDDGADILDIGGESTRPGAEEVSNDEEIERVIPVIKGIKKVNYTIPISVDTTKYAVAEKALDLGVDYINDISALDYDERIAQKVAEYDAKLILMHMQGTPRIMQKKPQYENVVGDILKILKEKIENAKSLGVKEIIADVGIGFGKSLEHNLKLMKYHDKFIELNVPLLIGLSRKSFIGMILDIDNPRKRDFATAVTHTMLLTNKIDIIRVHHVEKIIQIKKIFEAFRTV